MKKLLILKNYKNFIDFINSLYSIKDNMFHINNAVKWLLNSQINGYRHSFHFVYGWQKEYPETTGYIIPSLLEVYKKTKDEEIYNSVKKAVKWLKEIQNSDGSFNDLQGNKQIFDTGQILIGFNYIYENFPEFDIKDNLIKAIEWLVLVQNEDGSFTKFSYNNLPHTYYSRVGAAILKSGFLLDDKSIKESGIKNIEWVMSNQLENGFFKYSSFANYDPFLHTMVYILEGLLDAYDLLKDENILKSILKFSDTLLEVSKRDNILYSQYNEEYIATNKEYCMTGLSQWAGVCFRLYKITKKEEYKEDGIKTLNFVKSKQIISSNKNLNGGISGSIPLNGKYMKYSIPNWGVKFFIDALMKLETLK